MEINLELNSYIWNWIAIFTYRCNWMISCLSLFLNWHSFVALPVGPEPYSCLAFHRSEDRLLQGRALGMPSEIINNNNSNGVVFTWNVVCKTNIVWFDQLTYSYAHVIIIIIIKLLLSYSRTITKVFGYFTKKNNLQELPCPLLEKSTYLFIYLFLFLPKSMYKRYNNIDKIKCSSSRT